MQSDALKIPVSSTVRLDQLSETHRRSNATALVEAATGETLDYAGLSRRIRDAADALSAAGVGRDERVVLKADKTIDAIVVVHAVMRCGATCIPLDPDLPIDRLHTILAICGAPFVIAATTGWHDVAQQGQGIAGVTGSLQLFRRASDARPAVAGKDGRGSDGKDHTRGGNEAGGSAETAFIIFTSGSTGRPKGVPISHRSALAFLASAQARVGYEHPMTYLSVSPLFFDASILDVYMTLALGGTLVLAPKIRLPSQVSQLLERYRITDTLMVSSLIKMLVSRFGGLDGKDLSSLRSVWYGAEPCAVGDLKALMRHVPDVLLIHGYGPTEATHTTTMYVTRDLPDDDDVYLPIDTPLATVDVDVVDEDLKPVSPGEVGELLISGVQVMDGYINDDAMTRAAFVTIGGRSYYRSNDLVRADKKGNLVFLGRRDDAVKVQGHLVHLGEIEVVAKGFPDIDEAVASPFDTSERLHALALHYISEEPVSEADLLGFMTDRLPKYMLPTRFIHVPTENMRWLPTGKLDRKWIISVGR